MPRARLAIWAMQSRVQHTHSITDFATPKQRFKDFFVGDSAVFGYNRCRKNLAVIGCW